MITCNDRDTCNSPCAPNDTHIINLQKMHYLSPSRTIIEWNNWLLRSLL